MCTSLLLEVNFFHAALIIVFSCFESAVCRILCLERHGNITKRPIRRGKICILYMGKPLV